MAKQILRYSTEELDLIKSVFADNDNALKALQKVILQLPLNVVELATLEGWKGNKPLKNLLRKCFLPQTFPTGLQQVYPCAIILILKKIR